MILRSDIINALFEHFRFKSYLEIGVASPTATFDLIKAINKTSVDPRKDQGDVYTHNMTSDEFFEKVKYDSSAFWDVIFIDGMHTEKQVYKDIKNSINHLNKGGFIVAHDCNPSTEERIATNNGTVFKGFISVKNHLSEYLWSCFVVDEDDGCGIITRRSIFTDSKYQKIDIQSLTWGYFNNNRKKLLQLISFDKYLEIIKGVLI